MGLETRSTDADGLTAVQNGNAAQPGPANARQRKSQIVGVAFGVTLLISAVIYYCAIRPEEFGFAHDDGVYVTTAKALATAQGYRIISLPYAPAQTKYPPFYPLLLSLIWRAHPQFPDNLIWMSLLSVATAVGFLAVTYRYLVKHNYAAPWQVLIVIGLAAVNWRTIILATSVYSEMVYTLLSVAGLFLAEKYEKETAGHGTGLATGVLMGLAFLTRTIGVSLLIAVGLYYVLRRQWRRALMPLGVASLFVAGWIVWCLLNKTTADAVNVGYYTSYLRDTNELIGVIQTQTNASTLVVFLLIIAKNALGLILLSVPVVCLGIDYSAVVYFGFAFIFVAAGFVRQCRRSFRLVHIYVLCYLAIALPVPYPSYDRYLMPLLPFLLLFLVTELEVLVSILRKELKASGRVFNTSVAAFIGLGLLVAAGITIYNYGSGVYWRLAQSSLKKNARASAEDASAIEWIKANTAQSDTLICYRDPLYYLYTDRKGTQSVLLRYGGFIRDFKTAFKEREQTIFRIIEENKARYLILTPSDFENEYKPDFLRERFQKIAEQHPESFVLMFESASTGSRVYRIENNGGTTNGIPEVRLKLKLRAPFQQTGNQSRSLPQKPEGESPTSW